MALGSLDCFRLSRAPCRKYNDVLGPSADSLGRAIAYFRKVVKEVDNDLVRTLAREREFLFDAPRIFFTPYAPLIKGAKSPNVLPEGIRCALGTIRTLSRIAKDVARLEPTYLRAFDTSYGYLSKDSFVHAKADTKRRTKVF